MMKYETSKGVHDPTIIYWEQNKRFYMYSTDTRMESKTTQGIQVRTSTDLENWEYIGTALEGIHDEVYKYTRPSNLWAPEVKIMGNVLRMYYSASIFGTNESCICMAESNHPEGPWQHKGVVLSSHPEKNDYNAIDANVLFDHEGKLWMTFGSFFSGIFITELDVNTGFLKDKKLIKIASRPITIDGAIEGPFIHYREENEMYYLFTSYDFLGKNYNVRVARSKKITGPYHDINDLNMFGLSERPHQNGLKIIGSYRLSCEPNWYSIGHNSVFEYQESDFFVSHTRIEESPHSHFAFIREILWSKSGWPLTTVGINIKKCDPKDYLNNFFEIIVFDNEFNGPKNSDLVRINSNWEYIVYQCEMADGAPKIGISGITDNNEMFFGVMEE